MSTPYPREMMSEDDKNHMTLLLWRIRLVDLAKMIGISAGALSQASLGNTPIQSKALEKLRALQKDQLTKTRKPPKRGVLTKFFYAKKPASTELAPFKR